MIKWKLLLNNADEIFGDTRREKRRSSAAVDLAGSWEDPRICTQKAAQYVNSQFKL
jgi:hypothetical protein